MKKTIPKQKVPAKGIILDPSFSTSFPAPGRRESFFSWISSISLNENILEKQALTKIFNKGSFSAFLLFSVFALFVFWKPLTHPDMVPGCMDISYFYAYKYVWIQSLKNFYPAFWDPFSALGQPFLAMTESGPYAPLNFLFFIFSVSYAFTLSYYFHFLLAAVGTYFFIRGLGCVWLAGCLGGLSFAFSGFFVGHLFAGHTCIVLAASWIPFVFFGVQRFTNSGLFSDILLAAVAMGFCVLEGMPQMNMYAMMFSGLLLGWGWVRRKITFKQLLLSEIVFVFVSFSLSLCQLAPAYQFARLSDRWVWQWNDLMKDYFSPSYLRILIQPFALGMPGGDIGRWGYHEIIIYIGLIPFFLASLGFLWLFLKRPFVWWLFLVILFSTLLAMGDSTTFTHSFYLFFFKYLPGFGHNRSIGRIMVVTAFALSSLAGLGLDAWFRYWRGQKLGQISRALLLFLTPGFLLIGTITDLWRFDEKHLVVDNSYSILSPATIMDPSLLAKIQLDDSYPRVQPEGIEDYEILHRISAAMTGYPVLIQTSHKYLAEQWRYNETPLPDLIRLTYRFQRPEWKVSDRWQPLLGNAGYMTDTKAFPRAFMVGGYEVDPDTDQTVYDIRDAKVDAHQEVILTAEPEGKPSWPQGWVGAAKITQYDFNDLEMDCTNNRPCFLFLSDTYYPGWRATVDGKEETVYQADSAFRVVELKNPGHHTVKMSYHPGIIVYTFWYSLFIWVVLLIGWLKRQSLGVWVRDSLGGIWPFSMPLQTSPRTVELAKEEILSPKRSNRGKKIKL